VRARGIETAQGDLRSATGFGLLFAVPVLAVLGVGAVLLAIAVLVGSLSLAAAELFIAPPLAAFIADRACSRAGADPSTTSSFTIGVALLTTLIALLPFFVLISPVGE
jgi:hypothetical protein